MDLLNRGSKLLKFEITEKAIDMLHITEGIEKAFLLNKHDRKKIAQLEEKDESINSRYFGKKDNVGVKHVLRSDILICFITNMQYNWPKNNLKIVCQGETIGEDVSDIAELEKLKQSNEHCVFGNIVINCHKFKKIKDSINPPMMIISAKSCPKIEEIPFVSEAMVASPSKLTDTYIKSKIELNNAVHVGSFLVGLNIEHCDNHVYTNYKQLLC